MSSPIILGIESSCDETAAAVVRGGDELLSNVVASQIATHQMYGGVVPELASREHLRTIVPVVRQALEQAGQTYQSLDAIAVTQGPGLAGALLVGVTYAKALAWSLEKPLIAVNHLEGHIHAVLLEERQKGNREVQFPVLALVVSGGHTHLYLADETAGVWRYRNVGKTRDDAAGEAYDKVAKLLGLGYPGGPVIDMLAAHGDSRAVKFGHTQIKHPNRGEKAADTERIDFSYSGIKTAVLRHLELKNMRVAAAERAEKLAQIRASIGKLGLDDYLAVSDKATLDLAASFQRAMVQDLFAKTAGAVEQLGAAMLIVTGGVAANSALREKFERESSVPVFFPSRKLATDNAAMIAAAAYPKFIAADFATMDFSAEAALALGST